MFEKAFASRLALRLAALLIFSLPGTTSYAQAISEAQLTAAYLVNFLKYIEWPDTQGTVTICLFGRNDIAYHLAAYEGRSVAGRELHIRKVSTQEQLAGCQELYIPIAEEARIGAILRWTDKLPILTVSNADSFAHDGGGIGLNHSEERLKFDINHGTLIRNGLKPGSQLLRLARQVIGTPR
jgi:hypothetical protein